MTEELKKPKKVKEKVLSFKDIEKQSKVLNTWSKFYLEDGITIIKYKKEFGETDIQQVLFDLNEDLQKDLKKKKEDQFFTDDESFYTYLYFLIIKHFSHFKDSFKDNSLELNLLRIEKLAETGYFKLFFDKIFANEEVSKVLLALKEKGELIDNMNKMNKELMERLTKLPGKNSIDKMVEEAVELIKK